MSTYLPKSTSVAPASRDLGGKLLKHFESEQNTCWSVLGSLVEQVEVNKAHFSHHQVFALHQELWRFRCRSNAVTIVPGFLPLTQAFIHTLSLEPILPFVTTLLLMKLVFDIKTEPVTQASTLALIAIYLQSPPVCVFCVIMLVVIVYLALCLAPH